MFSSFNIKSGGVKGKTIAFLSILLSALKLIEVFSGTVFSSFNNFKYKETILILLQISSGTIKGSKCSKDNFFFGKSFKIGYLSKKLMKLLGISRYIFISFDK